VQIARYILMLRLGPDDEISRDGVHWYPVREVAEVDPDKRLANPSLQEGERQQLEATQRWIEEHPELFTHPSRSRGVEYELALEEALQRHRLHLPGGVNRRLGISVALVLSVTIFVSAFLIPKGEQGDYPQCEQAPMSGVNWNNCRLQGRQLGNSDLRHARLRNADLSGSVLRAANLSQSDIAYTNLSLANLRGANLEGADMTGANLRNADLRSANLKGVNLSYADLSGVDLSGAEVEGARFDYAILSDEFTCMPKSLGRCIPAQRNP